jgi:hypothetical protein
MKQGSVERKDSLLKGLINFILIALNNKIKWSKTDCEIKWMYSHFRVGPAACRPLATGWLSFYHHKGYFHQNARNWDLEREFVCISS